MEQDTGTPGWVPPQLPEKLMQLESLPTRCKILEARSETVKQHIETVLDGS